MRSCSHQVAIALFVALGAAGAGGRAIASGQPQAQPPGTAENGVAVSAETFCSETRLRTTNARITWTVAPTALEARGVSSLSAARQVLEATVYKNGFDKGMLVALPVTTATPEQPVLPQAQAQARQPLPRAFQIRLIQVTQPAAARAAGAPAETTAVVENLEPGVNYTWRIAIEAGTNRIVSPATTVQARTCPADMVGDPAVPRRKK